MLLAIFMIPFLFETNTDRVCWFVHALCVAPFSFSRLIDQSGLGTLNQAAGSTCSVEGIRVSRDGIVAGQMEHFTNCWPVSTTLDKSVHYEQF